MKDNSYIVNNKLVKLVVFFCIIVFPTIVNAELTNKCSGYTTGDCAYCVYEFSNNDNNDYTVKFSLTYKSDSDAIDFDKETIKNNISVNYGIRLTFEEDVDKDDFINGNSIKCPNIGYKSGINYDTQFRGQVWNISKNGANQLSPTSESKIVKNETDNKNTKNKKDDSNCNSLLGYPDDKDTPAYYLQIVFDVMKYIAIILLIVLSTMDFFGAVTSSDDNAMKKAASKCVKRLILCVIIFFIPMLLEYILTHLGVYSTDICGIN